MDSGTISVLATAAQIAVLGAGIWAIASMLRRFILLRRCRYGAVALDTSEPRHEIDEPNRRAEYLDALQVRALGTIVGIGILIFVLSILSAPFWVFVAGVILGGVVVVMFGVVEAIKTWDYIKSLRE